jgi:hypothetical protein
VLWRKLSCCAQNADKFLASAQSVCWNGGCGAAHDFVARACHGVAGYGAAGNFFASGEKSKAAASRELWPAARIIHRFPRFSGRVVI